MVLDAPDLQFNNFCLRGKKALTEKKALHYIHSQLVLFLVPGAMGTVKNTLGKGAEESPKGMCPPRPLWRVKKENI